MLPNFCGEAGSENEVLEVTGPQRLPLKQREELEQGESLFLGLRAGKLGPGFVGSAQGLGCRANHGSSRRPPPGEGPCRGSSA